MVDELVDLAELIEQKGAVAGDCVSADALEEEAQLLCEWPKIFAPEQPLFPSVRRRKAAAAWLVEAHVRACDQRGAEVRADLGLLMVTRPVPRTSIDSWRWR